MDALMRKKSPPFLPVKKCANAHENSVEMLPQLENFFLRRMTDKNIYRAAKMQWRHGRKPAEKFFRKAELLCSAAERELQRQSHYSEAGVYLQVLIAGMKLKSYSETSDIIIAYSVALQNFPPSILKIGVKKILCGQANKLDKKWLPATPELACFFAEEKESVAMLIRRLRRIFAYR